MSRHTVKDPEVQLFLYLCFCCSKPQVLDQWLERFLEFTSNN